MPAAVFPPPPAGVSVGAGKWACGQAFPSTSGKHTSVNILLPPEPVAAGDIRLVQVKSSDAILPVVTISSIGEGTIVYAKVQGVGGTAGSPVVFSVTIVTAQAVASGVAIIVSFGGLGATTPDVEVLHYAAAT